MSLVLFFDGDCGFCSRSVLRVHALDKDGEIDFAPLQGELSRTMGYTDFAQEGGGTMVLLREADGTAFLKGDAWIELGKALGGIWSFLAKCFGILPKTLRDWIYDLVAKNRSLLAGKGNACALPEESLKRRMRA